MSGECDKCGEHAVDCKCPGCDMARRWDRFYDGIVDHLEKEEAALACGMEGCWCSKPSEPSDQVNHPAHYQGSSMEVIDIIEDFDLDFCLGNAVKYILRASKKGYWEQDLKKAIWYLERAVNG